VHSLCANILGGGNAIAAASRGVYAAAILGALQAFEAQGQPAVCLAGAGSAILPAGLLASGANLAQAEAIFTELSHPALWKRAARVDTGLFDPAPIDSFLASALAGCEIATAERCFAAVSHSLSTGEPELHMDGRLQLAVRAGLAPSGILPPLILDDGTILISGEHEIEALLAALKTLSASPVSFLFPNVAPLGPSATRYRHLSEGGAFRLTPFQSQTALDRRVRLETVLGALGGGARPPTMNVRSYAIPIPEGILPMDWTEWATLRDSAFEWTLAELERRDTPGDEDPTV
jgi:NTE family protein